MSENAVDFNRKFVEKPFQIVQEKKTTTTIGWATEKVKEFCQKVLVLQGIRQQMLKRVFGQAEFLISLLCFLDIVTERFNFNEHFFFPGKNNLRNNKSIDRFFYELH